MTRQRGSTARDFPAITYYLKDEPNQHNDRRPMQRNERQVTNIHSEAPQSESVSP